MGSVILKKGEITLYSQKLNHEIRILKLSSMDVFSEDNFVLLSPRFFKKAMGILQSPPSVRPSVRLSVRLSVRPSRYLLLNHWTKFNQIWCVGCSHEWGVQRHIFFWPHPLGPRGGAKRSNIIKCH